MGIEEKKKLILCKYYRVAAATVVQDLVAEGSGGRLVTEELELVAGVVRVEPCVDGLISANIAGQRPGVSTLIFLGTGQRITRCI